jgi:hypothetical protein
MWLRWFQNPHLFSNRGEPVQPLFGATESTTIAITTAVLQAPEVEPLQWILPEEGVLPSIKVFCSKTTSQINLESSRDRFLIQDTGSNHEQTQHGNNSTVNNSSKQASGETPQTNAAELRILHPSLRSPTGKTTTKAATRTPTKSAQTAPATRLVTRSNT